MKANASASTAAPWKHVPKTLLLMSWLIVLLVVLAAQPSLVDAVDAPASAANSNEPQTCDAKSSSDATDTSSSIADQSDDSSSSGSVMPAQTPAPVPAPRCASISRADAKQKHVVFVSIAIKGHAQPLLRIASEMKARGYRVSFATHESGKDWATSCGLPFISAGPFPISAEDLRSKLKAMTRDSSNFRGILTMFNDIYIAAARPMFDTLLPQLAQSPPDLVVMDIATIGAQDLVHKLQIPYIVNSPSIMFDLGGTPSYIPAWGTGYSIHMSLWNRCMNILFPRLLSVALTPPFMQLNKMRWELELKPYRSQHDVFKGARVILNTAFGLEHPQPMSPLIDAVGPILPIQEGKNATASGSSRNVRKHHLGSSLLSWLDASQIKSSSSSGGGVVYLNLGTLAYIDSWQAQALIDGLVMRAEEPPVRVLWILPTDQRNILPNDLPPSLKVKSPSGVSNIDILSHPAVRLVISHCGMVSAQEALVYQKPLLCIPFLVDQPDVAARVVDSGAGLAIDKNVLSLHEVHRAVKELLSNGSFARQAARVGRLLELAGGTNRAIDVIDNSLRTGFRHLETLDLTFPWHKTALLDVWTVYAALFCILAFAIRIHWLLLYFVISEALSFVGGVLFGPSPAGGSQGQSSSLTTTDDANGNATSNDSNSATQKESDAGQESTESSRKEGEGAESSRRVATCAPIGGAFSASQPQIPASNPLQLFSVSVRVSMIARFPTSTSSATDVSQIVSYIMIWAALILPVPKNNLDTQIFATTGSFTSQRSSTRQATRQAAQGRLKTVRMAMMMNKSSKRASLLAVLLMALVTLSFTCTSVAAADAQKGNVVVLTEENFEHLTQASTGATTGDWLVKFYAPWCGHCKKLVSVWEELADELKGAVNVAKVDVTENSELGKRFGIRGYPTLLLFRQGKVYKFSGARSVDDLSRFARSGYKTLVGEAVPAAPTLVNFALQHVKVIQEDFVTLLGTKKNVLLVTFSGGLLFGLLLGCLCGCCTGRGSATKKTKTS